MPCRNILSSNIGSEYLSSRIVYRSLILDEHPLSHLYHMQFEICAVNFFSGSQYKVKQQSAHSVRNIYMGQTKQSTLRKNRNRIEPNPLISFSLNNLCHRQPNRNYNFISPHVLAHRHFSPHRECFTCHVYLNWMTTASITC